MSNYYSVVKYFEGASGESTFTITFPYLRRDHVFVYLSEEPLVAIDPETGDPNPPVSSTLLVRGVHYAIDGNNTVVLNDPLASQHSLTIRRFTEKDARLATYFDASYLTETELNEVTLQLLYLIQELHDFRVIGEGGGLVPGDPGDGGQGGPSVEDIIAGVLETPLFNTLSTLIPFVDYNAESIIRNALAEHENWRIDGKVTEVFDQFLEETGANFISVQEAIESERFARATDIQGVTAKFADAEAFVIGIQEAYGTTDEAHALLVQQVEARLLADDLETSLANSSYISGVETRVTQTEDDIIAEGNKIDSLVSRVNTHVVDPDGNIVPGSNIALVQTTANTAVNSANASASKLQTLGSTYGLDPNNWTAAQFASAIQTEYETYADENLSEASRFFSLQAQSKPTIFSSTPPHPSDEPYATEWASFKFSSGFPGGMIWVRSALENGRYTRRQYEWLPPNSTVPDGIDSSETDGPDAYQITWSYMQFGIPVTRTGRWVDTGATALGALVGREDFATVSPDSASGMLRDFIQASAGDVTAQVENRMRVDIEGPDGNVEAEYSTRINVTRPGGDPVIAGFGLGVAGEPGFEKSDFIVMANRFSLIAPPSQFNNIYSESESGNYQFNASPDDVIVPFLVDTSNRAVYINGNLFISDTLYGYQGRLREVHLGKAVFGQMYSDANDADARDPSYNDLVDPDGYRFELTSSTDGFWTGPSRDYLMWAGSGTKNDNNAKFWVDSEGNAFFGGTVQAGNIAGSLSNVFNTSVSINPWATATSSTEVTAGSWRQFDVNSSRLLTPVFMVNVAMVHGRSGLVTVEARYKLTNGDWSNWINIAGGSFTMDRTDGQQNVSLQGTLPININTEVQMRVKFSAPYGTGQVSCAGWSALVLMLPDSPTTTQGGGGESSAGGSLEGVNPDGNSNTALL